MRIDTIIKENHHYYGHLTKMTIHSLSELITMRIHYGDKDALQQLTFLIMMKIHNCYYQLKIHMCQNWMMIRTTLTFVHNSDYSKM